MVDDQHYPPRQPYERQFSRENMEKIDKIREGQRKKKLVPNLPQASSSRKVNYNNLDKKGSWLDKYAGNMDDLKDLALSGSFEQMEQKIITQIEENSQKPLYNQDEISKIVDTLDLSNPKALQFEREQTEQMEEELENQVLTNEFMDELGLGGAKKVKSHSKPQTTNNKEAFDCDISALNNNMDDSVERDLVKQMTPPQTQNIMKKQKKAKVVTNIEGARNAHRLQQREAKRKREKMLHNKKSLRDKFRLKLEHGRVIQNDPEAFTNESQITINQNTTLNKFNPLNPANFPTTKNEVKKFDNEIEKLESELNNLNQYAPQINKIERFVGVSKGYRHTNDFLNKHNQDYMLEETMGYHDEGEIEESVDRLDDLLEKKKQGYNIPFVGGPAIVRRHHHPAQEHQYTPMNMKGEAFDRRYHQPNQHMPMPMNQRQNNGYSPIPENLQFAKHSPQVVRKYPHQIAKLSESGEFVNTNPQKYNQAEPAPIARQLQKNKFSNHVSIRDSLEDKDLALEEEDHQDDDDMVTFEVDDAYDQEIEKYKPEDNVLPDQNDGYEIGAYKSGNHQQYGHQNVGAKPNFNFKKKGDPSLSEMETVYSKFPNKNVPQTEYNSGYPHTIQEVSAENMDTPQALHKQPLGGSKGKSLSESIEEEFEASQEETVVKGYAGRVKKMKQMKKRMEQKFTTGKGRVKPPKSDPKKEVIVETEHGNMMVKGGVDLKKLFL